MVVVSEILAFHLVEEVGGNGHLTAYLLLVINVRCHHHKARYPDVRHLAPFSVLEQLPALVNGQPVFCGFLCYVQFQQHVYYAVVACRLLVYLPKQSQGVHGLYHGYVRGNVFHLVSLKVSYKMPFYVIWQCRYLHLKLLLMAFAEDALSLVVCLLDIFRRMIFADGNQSHAIRQTFEHLMKIFCYINVRHAFSPCCLFSSVRYSGTSCRSTVFAADECSYTSIIMVSATLEMT